MKLALPIILLFTMVTPMVAQTIPTQAVEELIRYIHTKQESQRQEVSSAFNMPIAPTVLVLTREDLQARTGGSLDDVQTLIRNLVRQRVPVRWCQLSCPTADGEGKIRITSVLTDSSERSVVNVDLTYRYNTADPSRGSTGLERGSFILERNADRWVVIGGGIGYYASYSTVRN
jgi:hypothetical protein